MTEESLFQRLWLRHDNQEDFFTEILGFLLSESKVLADQYLRLIFARMNRGIEPETSSIEVFTQYTLDRSRPDMLMKFKDKSGRIIWVVFEHKLWAGDHYDQLNNYKESLEKRVKGEISEENIDEGYLVFIASYYPTQQQREIADLALTWSDVYLFLERFRSEQSKSTVPASNEILHQFINFMQELGMKTLDPPKKEYINAMKSLPLLVQYLEGFLSGQCWDAFNDIPYTEGRVSHNPGGQLTVNSRWAYYHYLGAADDEFAVFIGIYFDGTFGSYFGLSEPTGLLPFLVIWLESNPSNRLRDSRQQYCAALQEFDTEWMSTNTAGVWPMVYKCKSIMEFINEDRQNCISNVQAWFALSLCKLKDFLRENPPENAGV